MRNRFLILLIFFVYQVLTNECGFFFIEMRDYEDTKKTYSFNIFKTICLENGITFYAISNDITLHPNLLFDYLRKKGSEVYKRIKFSIQIIDNHMFNIKIMDANSKKTDYFERNITKIQPNLSPTKLKYSIVIYSNPMHFQIKRRTTNELLFDTTINSIYLSPKYNTLSTIVPSKQIYGFGTRFNTFKINQGKYTIWNKDNPSSYYRNNKNTYASHPVFLCQEKSLNYFIVLLQNLYPIEMDLKIGKTKQSIEYKLIGGNLDFVFIIGSADVDHTIAKYHEYIGKAQFFPFWAMGVWQSRFGYKSIFQIENEIRRFRFHNLPLEGIFLDIDAYDKKKPFLLDRKNYPLQKIREIKKFYNLKIVPIVEPVIASTKHNNYLNHQNHNDFDPEKIGFQYNIFLKDLKGNPLFLRQWCEKILIPDFLHPNITEFWKTMLSHLHSETEFDGVWLDMNEISIFEEFGKEYDSDEFPFIPKDLYPDVSHRTVNINTKHYDGTSEYDFHTLYSKYQVVETYNILKKDLKKKIPFIVTRASTVGVGAYAQTWSGDNRSTFDFLRLSISSMFAFGFFGFSQTGSDICGFMGNANSELCARWYQVATFSPFFRNHNNDLSTSQEPYTFKKNLVLRSAKKATSLRYSLLKWFYSLFIKKKGLGMVIRPTFFDFSYDPKMIDDEAQFLVGEELLIIPVLVENSVLAKGVFPLGVRWYDYFTGKNYESGIKYIYNRADSFVPTFIKEGSIIFYQNTTNLLKTEHLSSNFSLKIAFLKINNNTYLARGMIIGFSELSEENIVHLCEKDDCMLDLVSILRRISDQIYSLKLKFRFKNIDIVKLIRRGDLEPINILKLKIALYSFNINNAILYDKNGQIKGKVRRDQAFCQISFETGLMINANLDFEYIIK